MTVSIDVDLNARSAAVKIGALKTQLEGLGDDLDLDLGEALDGDLGDTLENLSSTMDEISESFNSDLNETLDRIENLEFDNLISPEGNGDSGGGTGSDSGDESANGSSRTSAQQLFETWDRSPEEVWGRMGGKDEDGGFDFDLSDFEIFGGDGGHSLLRREGSGRVPPLQDGKADDLRRQISSVFGDDFGFELNQSLTNGMREEGVDKIIGDTENGPVSLQRHIDGKDMDFDPSAGGRRSGRKGGLLDSLTDKLTTVSNLTGDLKKGFRKAIPSMSTWINLVGAAVPALGAMAVQAGAVAASMGAIAGAGAAMIGLGLLGSGDSMAESFRNAGKEVDSLKKDLFETFEPAADLFSGVQSEFFDFAPGELDRVQEAMQGLLVFKEDVFSMFRGITKFAADFFNLVTSNASKISEMSERFGSIISTGILNFFNWLLATGYRNQDMLIELGAAMKKFGVALYELFLLVGSVVQMLSGLFTIFAVVAKVLNNDLVVGMIAIVTVMYMVSAVTGAVIGSMTMLATVLGTGLIPLFSKMFIYMSTWLFQTLTQTMANYGLAASIANVTAALGTLMAMSGVGLAIAGLGLGLGKLTGMMDIGDSVGGYSGSDFPGSSEGVTTINEGDTVNVDLSNADNSTVAKFGDMRGGGDRGPTNGSYTS